jgi:hypothetical protein
MGGCYAFSRDITFDTHGIFVEKKVEEARARVVNKA